MQFSRKYLSEILDFRQIFQTNIHTMFPINKADICSLVSKPKFPRYLSGKSWLLLSIKMVLKLKFWIFHQRHML